MNNYQVLGLKGSETKDEIKSKFRSLSKQLHPDVNGGDASKTKKFIEVLKAYNELMEGVTGFDTKQNTQTTKNTQTKNSSKEATYKFITIVKDKDGYIIRIKMNGVRTIYIRGKDGNIVGTYNTDGEHREYSLRVSKKTAKLAKYQFTITMIDSYNYSATITYKVNPPKKNKIIEVDDYFLFDIIYFLISLLLLFLIIWTIYCVVT